MEFNLGDIVRIKSRKELRDLFIKDDYVRLNNTYGGSFMAKPGCSAAYFKANMYRGNLTDFVIVTKMLRGSISGLDFVYGIANVSKKHVYADKYLGDWLTLAKPKTHHIDIYD
jgi:hypothetical protein